MQLLPTNQEDKRTMSSHVYEAVSPDTLGLSDIIGQDAACKIVGKAMSDISQFPAGFVFHSTVPGVGKTLMAYVVRNIMRAALHGQHLQYTRVNGRDLTVEDVRALIIKHAKKSFVNNPKLIVVDEAQGLGIAAREAFLAFMDEATDTKESHKTTIVFTTTDIEALKSKTSSARGSALVSRCILVEFKPLDKKDMMVALNRAAKQHGEVFTQDLLQRVASYANGSLRRALVAMTTLHGVTDKSVVDAVLNSAESEENPIMPVITQYIFMPNTRRENWEKIMQHRILGGTLSELRMPIIAMATNALAGKAKATEFSVTNKKVLAGDTAVINMLINLITDLSQYSDIPVISEGQIVAALSRLMVK
jgi:replication-associated recombination protein RarA